MASDLVAKLSNYIITNNDTHPAAWLVDQRLQIERRGGQTRERGRPTVDSANFFTQIEHCRPPECKNNQKI